MSARVTGRLRRIGRRLLRVLRGTVVAVLLLAAVLVASLALAPVRGALLRVGVALADRALPGTLTVDGGSWPHPGSLELRGIVWLGEDGAAAPDTLLHVRRLACAVDVEGLRHRDLDADSLVVDVVLVDLPGLAALFPAAPDAADSAQAPPPAAGWTASFPRAGSVVGLPSLAVRRASLKLGRGTLAPDLDVAGVRLEALVDLQAAREPEVDVIAGSGNLRATGASPFGLDLAALAMNTHWDESSRTLRVDSLATRVAALGPPELAARWRRLDPLVLRGSGQVFHGPERSGGRFALSAAAPVAPLLGPAWPAGLDPQDFARVSVELTLAGEASADSVAVEAGADFAVQSGPARVRLAGAATFASAAPLAGRIRVDTLAVAVAGAELGARGTLDRGSLDGVVRGRLSTPVALFTGLAPAAAAACDGAVALAGRVGGSLDDPRLELDLQGSLGRGPATARRFDLRVAGDRRDVALVLGAEGTVVGDSLAFADSLGLRLRLRPVRGGDLRAGGALAADLDLAISGTRRGGRGRVVGRAVVDPADPASAVAELDTIDVAVPGLRVRGAASIDTAGVGATLVAALAAPCPLLETLVPELAGGAYAADVDLRADGTPDDPSIVLWAEGSCDLPAARVPAVSLRAEGSRREVELALRAAGGLELAGRPLADSLVVDAAYRRDAGALPLRAGIVVSRGADRAGLAAAAGADSIVTVRLDTLGLVLAGQRLRLRAPATVRLDTAARRLEITALSVAGDPGTLDLSGTLAPGRANLDAVVDLLVTEDLLQAVAPAEIWSRDGGFDLGVGGRVALAIGPEATAFDGGLRLDIRPHREETNLGAALDFRLVEGDSAGLEARFAATAADTALFHGSLRLPGRYDARRNRWVGDEDRQLELVVPEQTLPTGLLRRLLPPEIGLRGAVTVAAAARLPLGQPADSAAAGAQGRVEGVVRSSRLQLDLPNNSRIEVQADCRVSGTPQDPRLEGTLRVPSGFLRIPELPRNLHPAEGIPALWSLAAADSAVGDTLVFAAWGPGPQVEPPPPFLPDLDLAVTVPGNLRIRGYGLDVEVAADVRVRRGRDRKGRPGPSLHGDARSVRGSLKFMNRSFDIRQAEVRFTGSVPPDPELDLQLQARVTDTIINLRVTGRASDPVVDLTSDPELDRADIVAVLLFGRPLNSLDADQRGRTGEEEDPARQLQQNLAGLALAFGTADLQNSVSSTLGVDIVEVGADSQGGSTLTAGKFISPRILLKYNASLEKAGTYFVTLEYTLTEVFRIVTTYGQGEEASGLELKWLRRY